jgi:hypothetical protein
VSEILAFLDEGGSLDGTEEPLRVWLTCYQVLEADQDHRARSILSHAYNLVMERAGRIKDESIRKKFLGNIPCHQEILSAWHAHSP